MSTNPTGRRTSPPWATVLSVAFVTYVVLAIVLTIVSNGGMGPGELAVLLAPSALAGAVRLLRR